MAYHLLIITPVEKQIPKNIIKAVRRFSKQVSDSLIFMVDTTKNNQMLMKFSRWNWGYAEDIVEMIKCNTMWIVING